MSSGWQVERMRFHCSIELHRSCVRGVHSGLGERGLSQAPKPRAPWLHLQQPRVNTHAQGLQARPFPTSPTGLKCTLRCSLHANQ